MEIAEKDRELAPLTPTWLERSMLFLASVGIVALCLVVTITVVTRWLYRPVIPDDVLVVREFMVAVILWPLAAVTAVRGHIAVSVFTERLARKGRLVLSVLGHVVGLILFGALLWAGIGFLQSSWSTGEYQDGDLNIPMWIGHFLFVLALAVTVLRTAWMILRDAAALIGGGGTKTP